MTPLLRARDRRVLGPRGAATREAILAAAATHLRATPWHRASVPALTRDAGLTAGNFYQYFADLPDAVRTLLRAGGDPPEHLRLIGELLDFEDKHLGWCADE